jgi:hypothetical protein
MDRVDFRFDYDFDFLFCFNADYYFFDETALFYLLLWKSIEDLRMNLRSESSIVFEISSNSGLMIWVTVSGFILFFCYTTLPLFIS